MGDKQETFSLTHELVKAVLSRHKTPTLDEIQKTTFALVGGVLTTEQYFQSRWPGVVVPKDTDVREWIVGRKGWRDDEAPESMVAIDLNLAEEDLLDPTNHALGPMRWLGIFNLVHSVLGALHGDLNGQSLADGWPTVASLVGLLKPALKELSTVQIAVMAVAHDIRGAKQPWVDWLDMVNDLLASWRKPAVSIDTLRKEVAVLRKQGFSVRDEGADLQIPTTMIVVSVKHLKAVTQALRGK